MTLQNERFEELIAQHLAATLDGQRGKALAAFRQCVAQEEHERVAGRIGGTGGQDARVTSRKGEVPRRALWWWAGVPSAVAAGLAVVVMVQMGVLGRKRVGPQPQAGVVASSEEMMQSQTGDIVMKDNKPMRAVRQEVVKQTQWVDPQDHSVWTVTEPTVNVDYIQVQPN